MQGAGGEVIPTRGVVNIQCEIAGQLLMQEFVIASIVEPVLLGLDFIRSNRVVWDFDSGGVRFMDGTTPRLSCQMVTSVLVPNPPQSVQCCMVRVAPEFAEGSLVMVETTKVREGMEIFPSVGTIVDGCVPFGIINWTDYEELSTCQLLASSTEIERVAVFPTQGEFKGVSSGLSSLVVGEDTCGHGGANHGGNEGLRSD